MRVVCTLILLIVVGKTECQCTFPTGLRGTWATSGQGTWIVNDSHIQDFKTISDSGAVIRGQTAFTTLTFECHESRGTKYVLKSETFEYFVGSFISAYICLDFVEDSTNTNKYIFYKATNEDANGDQFKATANYSYDSICDAVDYKQAYRYRVALKSGSETTALIQCPSEIFGSYTYDTCTNTTSNTSMDVCDTRQQLIYNYTLCSDPHQMFSLEGTLDCIYFLSSGSTTYLTVYNRDNTNPAAPSYYRFSCMALTLSGSDAVDMTVYPERCLDNQNSSAIASPGYSVRFTPYYLCPLTTTTTTTTAATAAESSSSTDILPFIIGAVAALLLIALIIVVICCCLRMRRKKKKKQEDEEAINEDDDSEDNRSRPGSGVISRRSSQEGSRSSLDSGIEELKPTPRDGEGGGGDEQDWGDQVKELVIKVESDEEVDDKTSRPASRQLSRMSDLPPSTVPPDEEVNNRENPNEEQQQEDDVKSTVTEKNETDENPPAEEEENKPDKDPEKDASEGEPDVKNDDDDMEEEKQESDQENENEAKGEENKEEPDETVPQGDIRDPGGEQQKDDDNESGEEEGEDGERRRRKKRGGGGEDGELGSGEEENEYNTSDSEYQRELNRIGRKAGKYYQPSGALTTVLVSREEDERKRTKMTKTKKQKTKKMAKLARKRTRKLGDKGGKHHEDDAASSEDEMRFDRDGNAAFMEQYRQKKRLEHILDEQHYWSDPEDVQNEFAIQSDASSLLSSEYDEDDYEIIIDENGVGRRVKKSKTADDDDEYEIIVGSDGRERRVKKKKRGGDADGAEDDYEIIVGADGIERRIKKIGGTGDSTNISDEQAKKKLKSNDTLTNVEHPENVDNVEDKDERHKTGKKYSKRDTEVDPNESANTKLINVKERQLDDDVGLKRKQRGKGDKLSGPDIDMISEFNESDIDKISDVDSGLSEDDEPVDVILTQEQQQMIVDILFDEDMNLRPQFERDENGRIVRRLDNSVIYDPRTGRFTFFRRLGQLFKIPRLKRNRIGRPTGGYIQDEYGPKELPKVKGDSGKRGRVGSGKSSDPSTASPSADQKRSRTMEGKNVGFSIPDDDIDSMNTDQLEYNKRGRRDIGSAIRKSLNRRLFRKKRRRGGQEVSPLPEVQLQRSWTGDSFVPGSGDMRSVSNAGGGLGPMFSRSGRGGSFTGTPGQYRRSTGTSDLEQLQRNREGLEHDRRILDRHYRDRPWDTRQAFVGSDGEGDVDDESGTRATERTESEGGLCYRNPDGRLAIRERGCPDLKHHPQKDQLFTVVRRRKDLEEEEILREIQSMRRRDIHTAPVKSQTTSETARDQAHVRGSGDSLDTRASEGSQMTSIDDNRLRRLLEELYKDKKYFDRYIDTTEPKSIAVAHSQGLAEHGRGYLLERADYWEKRGPLPPRPPQTAIGLRMLRQQTVWASRDSQMNKTSTTMTCTPTQESIPGTIESPRGGVAEQENGQDKDGSIKFTDDPRPRDLTESEA